MNDKMQSNESKNVIIAKLSSGENILDEIKNVCIKHKVKTAIVISGIGQLKKAKLGYFKDKGNYAEEDFDKTLELLSLTGNVINQNNNYIIHFHCVLGDEKKNALGGHLLDGIVSVVAEIVLLKTDVKAYRKLDEKTGLKTLFLK